jgi:hypothetical protein
MKVLNLRCANGHGFEGWFASEEDFLRQNGGGQIECPLCADHVIGRLPSAPRLNLSGAQEKAGSRPAARTGAPTVEPSVSGNDLQTMWMQAVRHVVANTEDVGERFAEEARRIHYGETPIRGIRGETSPQEREALQEEGIEIVAMPMPRMLKGSLQ